MFRSDRQEDKKTKSKSWVIIFANLMVVLLCFFVMLFAISTVDQDKYEALIASLSSGIGISKGSTSIEEGSLILGGVNQLEELKEYYQNRGLDSSIVSDTESASGDYLDEMLEQSTAMQDKIEELLRQQNIIEQITMESNARFVQLTINETYLFEPEQAQIKQDATPLLEKLGLVMEKYADQSIEIIGYTDNGSLSGNEQFEDNFDLSFVRAKNIALYMANEKKITISRIEFFGRGEYDPVASNETEQGRALNKRIVIKIYNTLNSY